MNEQVPKERLCMVGLGVLHLAALCACFLPMLGLPVGIVGAALFLYGDRGSH